ncbi:MAG TPA: hypothetical protein VN522_01075 [Solirubrobacterales bacterium]|nr:hypothetical protein [Solirubrobacterales bacterium]
MPIRDDRRREVPMAIAVRCLPALLVLAAVFIAIPRQTVPAVGRPVGPLR